MTKVTQLIAVIEDLHNEEETAQAELKRVQDRIQQEAGKLRAELTAGGTTKDPVYDLVLKVGGGVNDPSLPKYRELQERLKGKKGEFVLIKYHAKTRQRFGGELRESDFCDETHFRIGVLQAEKLRLTKLGYHITLPIDQYLQGVCGFGEWSVYAEKQVIRDYFFEWSAYDQPPTLME